MKQRNRKAKRKKRRGELKNENQSSFFMEKKTKRLLGCSKAHHVVSQRNVLCSVSHFFLSFSHNVSAPKLLSLTDKTLAALIANQVVNDVKMTKGFEEEG